MTLKQIGKGPWLIDRLINLSIDVSVLLLLFWSIIHLIERINMHVLFFFNT